MTARARARTPPSHSKNSKRRWKTAKRFVTDSQKTQKMPLHRARVWIRYRARAIAGVKGNFKHSYVSNMGCRFCSSGSDETQDHLELCAGTRHERRGLDLGEESGLLDFWRRMKFKLAAVT